MSPEVMSQHRPTTADINLQNLTNNFKAISSFVGPDCEVMAVVKADAYGHGAKECASKLVAEGCRWLAVAIPEEALELRSAGIEARILCLGGFWPGQEELMLAGDITPAVFTEESAARLDAAAATRGIVAKVHVKIDTGMGRVGIRHDVAAEFAAKLDGFRHLKVEGLMSHFSSADDPDSDGFTALQIRRFDDAVAAFRHHGHDPTFVDIANSPGAVVHPRSRYGLVRIGGVLYGLDDDIIPASVAKPICSPVMSLTSRVTLLKTVPAGEPLGYSRTFTTLRRSVIASVPIGYHDGIPRALSNKLKVIVGGRFAPVVGRISMDWTLVDVTDIPGVETGDLVTFIGRDGGAVQTAASLASLADTISYEITCGISQRVPRFYHESVRENSGL